jgi:hypothetical protein
MSSSNTTRTPVTMEIENAEILNDIQGLQAIEKDLFSKLEAGIANGSLSHEDKIAIISQIDKVSQMRINSYQSLNDMNQFYQGNVNSSHNTLSEQVLAVGIVEDELKETKKRLEVVKNEKDNKQRLVEVNMYYGERYEDYKNYMKSIVFICIPIIILSLLHRFHILPDFIYYSLLIFIIVVSIVYLFIRTIYLSRHNKMDYQEYDWNFNLKNAPPINTGAPSATVPWTSSASTTTCVGQECCSTGETYDASMNQCTSGYGSSFLTGSSYMGKGPENGIFGSLTNGLSSMASDASQSAYQNQQNFMATATSFS